MKLHFPVLLSLLTASHAFVAGPVPRRAFRALHQAEAADEAAEEVDPIEAQEEVIEEYRQNLSFKRTSTKESDVSCDER